MQASPLITLAAIGLVGTSCQWLAWRLKIPAIVPLLLTGILAGPLTGLLDPDALFGELLFPVVSLGVAVILFEGSLNLQFHQIRGLQGVVRNLVTLGALVTGLVVAAGAHWLLNLSWEIALLFGALMTVTGPTVIKPLLHSVRPAEGVAKVLEWEGIILDPVGALLTVLVFEWISSGQSGESPWLSFAGMALTGTLFGVLGAKLMAMLLRHHVLPHFLHHVFTLVFVLAVFAAADTLQHESGLLAVTLMGILLANARGVDVEDILFFKEGLSLLFLSALFILLAARMEIEQLIGPGWPVLLLFLVLIAVARPLSVALSTLGSGLRRNERLLLAWMAPRGIVAAAVSSLFTIKLVELGYPGAETLAPLTFLMILGTVGLQSLTARPLAQWLQVAEPEPSGFLIVGANPVARALGESLQQHGFRVLLTDTGWENVAAAKKAGLKTYFGSVVSEHAERQLDLSGIGRLLALSPHGTLNALACIRFKHDFGPGNLYRLQTTEEKGDSRRFCFAPLNDLRLFGEYISHAQLASLLAQGGKIHATGLTEQFDFAAYHDHYQQQAIPLYALDPRGKVMFFTTRSSPAPKPGWMVVSLIAPEPAEEQAEQNRDRAENRQEKT